MSGPVCWVCNAPLPLPLPIGQQRRYAQGGRIAHPACEPEAKRLRTREQFKRTDHTAWIETTQTWDPLCDAPCQCAWCVDTACQTRRCTCQAGQPPCPACCLATPSLSDPVPDDPRLAADIALVEESAEAIRQAQAAQRWLLRTSARDSTAWLSAHQRLLRLRKEARAAQRRRRYLLSKMCPQHEEKTG